MSMPTPVLIDDDTARFLESGLSISLASSAPNGAPSLSRACGISLSPNRCELRVMVVRAQAQRVLADVARSARAAVVVSEVASHRTVQIKASDARVVPAADEDRLTVDRHVPQFAARLQRIGFWPAFVEATLSCRDVELAVVSMTPTELYLQTPGPHAGIRLGS